MSYESVEDLTYHLNRLASTLADDVPSLAAQGAANVWSGTTGLALVGALNVKAGTVGLDLQGVLNFLAGSVGLGPDLAASLITATLPDNETPDNYSLDYSLEYA